MTRAALTGFLLLLLVFGSASAQAPDARWRSYDTEHFRVTFPEELEPLARRAGDRAERAYALLSAELVPPRGRVELVLSHDADYANGFATVFPTERIVVYAHPPTDTRELSYYQDWLDLVILHELVHVFHLDRSRGGWRELRRVLGRNPLFFPNAWSPGWITEGLATYFESRLTGTGRVLGTVHEMTLRTAILEDEFFSIDRATGEPTRWPAGSTRYVYGSLFLDHLSRTYGAEKIPSFVERSAAGAPYLPDRYARRAIGEEFTDAWEEWERGLAARYRATADSLRVEGITEPEILTFAGRVAASPRYSASGALAYSAATGRDHPAIRLVEPGGEERVLRERATASTFSWGAGERLYYGDLDFRGPYRVYSDLYAVDREGEERRLTRGARLAEPDPHPDGRRLVAVADASGTNVLALYDLASGATRAITAASLDVQWSLPRWSPGGELIAASRWRAPGLRDVVVLDGTGAVVREITSDRAVDTAPAWSPDGRYLLFSSDRTGIADLYAYEMASGRLFQVTRVLTGAFEPDVSPDGRWIAFSYYRADGYHVARIPFDPAAWRPAPPPRADYAAPPPAFDYQAAAREEDRPYSPWRSLLPATWLPLADVRDELGLEVGILVAGVDVVGRHEWDAQLALLPDDARFEGAARYRYLGLGNPAVDLSASQTWDVAATRDAAGNELPTALLERERQVGASLVWLRRRWRSTSSLGIGGELNDPDRIWDDPSLAGSRTFRETPPDVAGVLTASYNSARSFGISLGPQAGGSLSFRAEGHRYLEPFAGEPDARGYLRLTGRGRRFHALPLPGFARHVLALRGDVAAEHGSVSPGLRVGGASGGALSGALGLPLDSDLLGNSVSFPIRGYPEAVQRGNRAVTASVEYRFPIARPERGIGLLPVFLERVWGDVFVDAGAAWCAGPCVRELPNSVSTFTPLPSVGAELDLDLHLGYLAALPLRFGVAVPLREAGERRVRGYVRVGRAF